MNWLKVIQSLNDTGGEALQMGDTLNEEIEAGTVKDDLINNLQIASLYTTCGVLCGLSKALIDGIEEGDGE